MSRFETLRSVVSFGAYRPHERPEHRESAAGIIPYGTRANWPAVSLDNMATVYGKISLIFRCVQYVAQALASASLETYVETTDEPIKNHPLRQLMLRPNPQMRENSFLANVAMQFLVTGFCVVEIERSAAGLPVALWPMRSDRLKAVPRGAFDYDWVYQIPSSTRSYPLLSENVITFTYADTPSYSPFGIGPIETILREAGILNDMITFIKCFFESGAVPLLGIIPDLEPGDRMSQKEIDDLDNRFAARHLGLDKAVRPVWLQNVKDIKNIGFDFNQLAYLDLRDVNEISICQAFGLDPQTMGIRAGLEFAQSRANATEGRKAAYEDVIVPLWQRMDDRFSLQLLPQFEGPDSNVGIRFNTKNIAALQEDIDKKAEWVRALFLGGGISQYAMHDELNMERPTTPDFLLRPVSVDVWPSDDPLGLKVEPKTTTAPPPPAGTTTPAKPAAPVPPAQTKSAVAAELELSESSRLIEMLFSGETHEVRRARGAAGSKRALKRLADSFAPKVQRYLDGQRDRIIAAGTRAWTDINWDAEHQKLVDTLHPQILATGLSAWDAASASLGVELSFKVSNPRVLDVIGRVMLRPKGIQSVTDETRTVVGTIVAQGQVAGKTASEIADEIRAQYDTTWAARAAVIARTESMVSYGYASAAAYRESGIVDRIQCFDNPNHGDEYGAEDGLSCAARDGFIDTLDSAETHVNSEHPNGSLVVTPIVAGDVAV